MSSIIKGTTPTIKLDFSTFEADVNDIVKISMLCRHGGKVWDVSDDVELDRSHGAATYHFSQAVTMALQKDEDFYIEVDVLMNDGEVYRVASGSFVIEPTLRKGELTNE